MPAEKDHELIVVGVDGSAGSDAALRWAMNHARKSGAEVHALMAWEFPASYGYAPSYDDFDWAGFDFGPHRFSRVMDVDLSQWERELDSHDAFFDRLGAKRPDALLSERDRLAGRMAM